MENQHNKELPLLTTSPKNPSGIESQVAHSLHFIKNKGFKPTTHLLICCKKCSESKEIRMRLLHQYKRTLQEFFKNHTTHGGYILQSGNEKWDLPIENGQEMSFDKVEAATINTNNEVGSIPFPAPKTPIESSNSQSDSYQTIEGITETCIKSQNQHQAITPVTEAFCEIDTDTFLEDGGLYEVNSEKELDLLIERVNARYFYVVIGTHGYVGYRGYDHLFKRQVIHYLTPHTFHELYAATRVKMAYLCDEYEELEAKQLTKIWMGHPKWRRYQGVVFSPDQAVSRYIYNLWQDFRKDAKAGDYAPFLKFVLEVICNRDEDHYKYVLAWMADAVQNITASDKPGVALVLRGERGTGKGFFATSFGSLFGQYFVHITHPEHLVGRFNRHLQDCILLFADEMTGDKKAMGILQGRITEPTITIEIKGKDVFQALNYMRIVVASNFDWVVPAGPYERRWAVFDVSSCHMQDRAYFSKLDHFMKNGGREALLHYLLNYDNSKIDVGKIPETSALVDQIVATMDGIESYWYSLLQKGVYPSPFTSEVEWGSELMVKNTIYEDYVNKTKQEKRGPRNETAFWVRIRKLCPSLKEVRDSTTGYKRAFEVPPLKKAREEIEKSYGHKFQWEEEE